MFCPSVGHAECAASPTSATDPSRFVKREQNVETPFGVKASGFTKTSIAFCLNVVYEVSSPTPNENAFGKKDSRTRSASRASRTSRQKRIGATIVASNEPFALGVAYASTSPEGHEWRRLCHPFLSRDVLLEVFFSRRRSTSW